MIERLCRQGDSTAALTLAIESRRQEDLRLLQISLAGILLALPDDPKKQVLGIMLGMMTSGYEPIWRSSMWPAISNTLAKYETEVPPIPPHANDELFQGLE